MMKRFAIIFLSSLLAIFAGYSQTHFDSRVDLGVKAGVSLSEVMFKPSITQSFGIGETAGITFRYTEENHFGLLVELNFVQRGWAEKFEEMPYKYQRFLNYIELPVMSHIYFGRRGKFFINAGPEIAYFIGDRISSNFDYKNPSSIPEFVEKNRTTEQLTMPISQKLDFGIVGGLGGEFSINRRNSLAVEARVFYGIGNVVPCGRQDYFSIANQLSISVTVGYWFRIK